MITDALIVTLHSSNRGAIREMLLRGGGNSGRVCVVVDHESRFWRKLKRLSDAVCTTLKQPPHHDHKKNDDARYLTGNETLEGNPQECNGAKAFGELANL